MKKLLTAIFVLLIVILVSMEIREPLVSEWVVALAKDAAELVTDAEKYRVETIKLTNSALEYEIEGQLDSAIIFFKRALALGENDAQVDTRFYLADAYYEKYEQAAGRGLMKQAHAYKDSARSMMLTLMREGANEAKARILYMKVEYDDKNYYEQGGKVFRRKD
jgi:tetratricopeptide (TPR) repeat protein